MNGIIVRKVNYCFENKVERKSRKCERPNKNIHIWFYYNNDYIKLIHVMYDYIKTREYGMSYTGITLVCMIA